MKELALHHYIDIDQRATWAVHEVIFFDHKNFKLYQTNSLSKFAEELGLSLTKLSALAKGRIKSHKGLAIWKHGTPAKVITHLL